jgi:hypothetical protein
LNAWKHAEESVRTELLLDLNRSLANELQARFPDAELDINRQGQASAEVEATTLLGKIRHWISRVTGNHEAASDTADSPPEADDTVVSTERYTEGVLDTSRIINRLYNVEEQEDHRVRGFIEAFRRLNKRTWVSLGVVILLWAGVKISGFSPSVSGVTIPVQLLNDVFLSGVVLAILLNFVSADLQDARESIEQTAVNPQNEWSGAYEDLFRTILQDTERIYEEQSDCDSDDLTFVITIDDIDRCENGTAYEILIALKSFLSVKNCLYIIPCDKQALLDHIESVDDSKYLSENNHQQNFLAKLIDIELEVSNPVPEQLDSYFDTQTENLKHDFDKGTLNILKQADFQTPRRLTRVLNRLVVLTELATNRSRTDLTSRTSATRTWRDDTDESSEPSSEDVDQEVRDKSVEEEAVGDENREEEHRENENVEDEKLVETTGESEEWDMRFLAIVAVLQESYPDLFTALIEDPYRLTQIYQSLGNGVSSTNQEGPIPYVDSLSLPEKEVARLVGFLNATMEIGLSIENPEPYLRLGGSARTTVSTFGIRLREGRTAAVLNLLDPDLVSQARYVDVIERHLVEEHATAASVLTVVEILEEFDSESQERIADGISKAVDQETEHGLLLEQLSVKQLGKLLERLEPHSISILMESYVESLIREDSIDTTRLAALSENFQNQLLEPEIQAAFQNAVLDSKQSDVLSTEGCEEVISEVNRICPQLFTPELVAGGIDD